MLRPFTVSVERNDRPQEIDVRIEFGRMLDDDAIDGLSEVMSTFGNLAACGALSGAFLDPGQAGKPSSTYQFTSSSATWILGNIQIDYSSIFILINMLHWLHLKVIEIRKLHIKWPGRERMPDLQMEPFPGQWPRLSFPIEIGDLLDDIDVEVNLRDEQPPDITKRIIDVMSIWLLATHRGAYADESFDPSKSAVFLGPDVMDVSANHVTWFIEIMRCNESALDGLINIFEWIHQNITGLKSVEIGP